MHQIAAVEGILGGGHGAGSIGDLLTIFEKKKKAAQIGAASKNLLDIAYRVASQFHSLCSRQLCILFGNIQNFCSLSVGLNP